MRPSMEQVYMEFAVLLSTRSTCCRQSNGAVLVSQDMLHVWGVGYNGVPSGMPHICDDMNAEGTCPCMHAELNALLKAEKTKDGVMFCTTSPCIQCAKAIIQAGICKVYYRESYRLTEPLAYLHQGGIETELLLLPSLYFASKYKK